MKIKTELLQKMVSKAIQGASNNKMIPLTSLIGIEVQKDLITDSSNLILITTDGSNQFKVNQKIEKTDEFYTIVNADTFSKLVGKTTTEFIELENKENYLLFTGNGDYKLEIAINEEGEMVKFPEINLPGEREQLNINLNFLQEAIKVAKASVAKTMEIPCLTGYYIGKDIITTDRQLACRLEDSLLDQESLLISNEMAELLLLVDGSEKVTLIKKDNSLLFMNDSYVIAGKELEGKEIYPVQAIENLSNTSYSDSIEVNRQELLNVLDRMSLFVTDYDKNGVMLAFTKEALLIKSQKSNAQELIDGKATREEEFDCLVDIEMLRSQLETISTEKVKIEYGQEKSIKIVDGKCTHIISLLEKE